MKILKVLPIVMLMVGIITGGGLENNTAEAGAQDFTIVNFSGMTIYHLYVSRSDCSGCGGDVLGEYGIIRHGESKKITFSSRETGKFWDMMVIFKDGTKWFWNGIDLETVYRVRIDGEGTLHLN